LQATAREAAGLEMVLYPLFREGPPCSSHGVWTGL